MANEKHYQQVVFSLIEEISGQKNILTIPKPFIKYTGSIEAALLLSQIIYWSSRTSDPDGWFYKRYIDWENEIALTKHKCNTAIGVLKRKKIIKTKVKKANGNPTLHFQLQREAFWTSFSDFLTKEKTKNQTSINRDYRGGISSRKRKPKGNPEVCSQEKDMGEPKSKGNGRSHPVQQIDADPTMAWLTDLDRHQARQEAFARIDRAMMDRDAKKQLRKKEAKHYDRR